MYCRPPATGPPPPSLNGSSIFDSAPPLLVEHDAGADLHHAQPELRGLVGLALPGDAHLGQEVVARRRVLVEALVAVRAVVADGAGADQRPRPRVGPVDRLDELAGALLARLAGSRLRASSVQRWATFSPARWTIASRPASSAGSGGPLRSETVVTSSPRSLERGDELRCRSGRWLR